MMKIAANEFMWEWTDWIGLIGLLLAIAFIITVIVALVRRTSPLAILDRTGSVLGALIGRRGGPTAKRKRDKKSN